ncbi:MAG: IclR family transcriptional regulator [Actinobacteria bacterium]|nr:IclR family transcriptional regulator [Actinomycetota bacterium]
MTVTELAPHQPHAEGELRSVSIAVAVLDCFADAVELGPTQVGRRMGIAKSTASRMLSALAVGGMLERTPAGRYRLSMRLFHYGQLAVDRLPLRGVARPVLLELHESLRELVQLGIPVGGHVLYVDRVGGAPSTARLSGEVVRRVPGYSSSAGRVMAAFDPSIARATAGVERRKHTPFTVTDGARLTQVLRQGRQAGWVASREEYELGYSSIAAPVLVGVPGAAPRVVGAISVVGPSANVVGQRREFVAASVCRAARRVGTALTGLRED